MKNSTKAILLVAIAALSLSNLDARRRSRGRRGGFGTAKALPAGHIIVRDLLPSKNITANVAHGGVMYNKPNFKNNKTEEYLQANKNISAPNFSKQAAGIYTILKAKGINDDTLSPNKTIDETYEVIFKLHNIPANKAKQINVTPVTQLTQNFKNIAMEKILEVVKNNTKEPDGDTDGKPLHELGDDDQKTPLKELYLQYGVAESGEFPGFEIVSELIAGDIPVNLTHNNTPYTDSDFGNNKTEEFLDDHTDTLNAGNAVKNAAEVYKILQVKGINSSSNPMNAPQTVDETYEYIFALDDLAPAGQFKQMTKNEILKKILQVVKINNKSPDGKNDRPLHKSGDSSDKTKLQGLYAKYGV